MMAAVIIVVVIIVMVKFMVVVVIVMAVRVRQRKGNKQDEQHSRDEAKKLTAFVFDFIPMKIRQDIRKSNI